jgi:putative heme-binding domain-containing protein
MQFAAIRLAGEWQQGKVIATLAEFAASEKDGALRGEALAALRLIGGGETVKALKKLVAENQPAEVRRGALIALAMHGRADALAALPSILKQTTNQNAAQALWRQLFQHAPFANQFASAVPKDLPASAYADALQIAKGMGRGGNALVAALQPLVGVQTAPRDYPAEIAALMKSVPEGGNSADGELVYRRIGCAACHAIGGVGGNYGPDFSSIGASAPLDYIIESTLNPAAKVKEGYHGFAFAMKDGVVMSGIPARETATDIIIKIGPGTELPLAKANLIKKENIGSLMPQGLIDALKPNDKRNLFAFLSQIGRPGPFDASKLNVARMWKFTSLAPGAPSAQDSAAYVMTLISGDLRAEDRPDKLYAIASFTAAKSTTKPLIFTGIEAAWLDGKTLDIKDGQCSTPIPAGDHQITVRPAKSATLMKAQCDDVTFVAAR